MKKIVNRTVRVEDLFPLYSCFYIFFILELATFSFQYDRDERFILPPPSNDLCEDASEIAITGAGFDIGIFHSDTFDMTGATKSLNEYFDFPMQGAGLDKKSIWFKFSIPTVREVTVTWLPVDFQITPDEVGFVVYKVENCAEVGPATVGALPAATQLGSSKNLCLAPGTYFIQVCGKDVTSGEIYLELNLQYPFTSSPPGNAPYDLPSNAYDFGTLTQDETSTTYSIGCQSIDGSWEYENLPVAVPEEYTKSTWHVFTIDGGLDVLSIILENTGGVALPKDIGFRLFEGNVQQVAPASLTVLEDAKLLSTYDTLRVREFICENLFQSGNTYSFQLIFPQNFYTDNFSIRICKHGVGKTGGAIPDIDAMDSGNILGVLPSSSAGEVTKLIDYFGCDARLSLAMNQCGTVNPAGEVVIGSKHYDLTLWAFFQIESPALVTFKYETSDPQLSYARIFEAPTNDDCSAIDAVEDLFAQFKDTLAIPCMPPGQYAIQLLGNSMMLNNSPGTPLCDVGLLGRAVELRIKVKSLPEKISLDYGMPTRLIK